MLQQVVVFLKPKKGSDFHYFCLFSLKLYLYIKIHYYEYLLLNPYQFWLFIRFKHNEHQVEDARKLASEMGFFKFELKDTRRFVVDKFPVLNKTISFLGS